MSWFPRFFRKPDSVEFTSLSSKARFSADDQLLLRMARAREELGDVPVKPVRKVIVETDTFVAPAHVDEYPIG